MSFEREPDWTMIRARAAALSPGAFAFVVEGLRFAVEQVYKARARGGDVSEQRGFVIEESRHVTGQQLSVALKVLAQTRYGMMAGTVLRHWGLRGTADFGAIVYAMIDRGDMRRSDDDRFEDFVGVYDFDEVFALGAEGARA